MEMKTLELLKLVSSGNLDGLDWRERKVVEERTGMRDGRPRTLQEIGERFGITRERVRQIEKAAAAKLRRYRCSAITNGGEVSNVVGVIGKNSGTEAKVK
jgi:RNA polymerase sigma factor (sigma-70 family)